MKSRKKQATSTKVLVEEKNTIVDKNNVEEQRESLMYFIYVVKNIIKTNMSNSMHLKKNDIFSVNDYNIFNQELENNLL